MPPSKHQARSPVHVESPAPNPFASNDDVLGALHGSDGGTGGMGEEEKVSSARPSPGRG
jgi:hypothetical protein